jgi:hypothetical protein
VVRHVVLFRWVDGTTAAQVAAVTAALDELAATVPSIRVYTHGPDLALGPGRFDYGVVADFDDADGWRAYDEDALHDQVRRDVIAPLVAERAALQLAI